MTKQQKFEAHMRDEFGWEDDDFYPDSSRTYYYHRTESAWKAWQARAAQDRSAELLEALERIVSFWDETVPADCVNSMHIQARAAISKARGE